MKQFILIIFFIFSIVGCKAQNKIDFISMKSRAIADEVLKKIDSIAPKSDKLLYSLDNKDFYVITSLKGNYQEYYIFLDDEDSMKLRALITDKKEKRIIANFFDLNKYHVSFITKMPDAEYVRGKNSYFVVKDEKGKRYGEYCLSSLTLPLPINADLAGYLIRKLSQEITKDKEASN